MADNGLTFLQIGYSAIWLGWMVFTLYLFLKHTRIKKDLDNLRNVLELKNPKESGSKVKFIAIFIIFVVLAFAVNGAIFKSSSPDEPVTVSDVLKNLDDYEEDVNFWTYGKVGTIFPGENNSARFKFILIDLANTNQTLLINTTLAPEGFEKDKKVVVTGSYVNENGTVTIKATRIDVGYPLEFHESVGYIYIGYTAVWLILFSILIVLNLKQSEMESAITELENEVSSHGRRRKR